MDKLKMHSPNFAEQNVARLAELFPNCVTEATDDDGKKTRVIDFDQLRQELSGSLVEGPRERYHLDWPGKRQAILTASSPVAKTLRPARNASPKFERTRNLFIEGDNLDALKLLQETYLSKIKMIYIDPPYNTGKDFIYRDRYAVDTQEYLLQSGQRDEQENRLIANSESNGRFHSDWLSMLYPRLKLSRNLLRDDGVIFISIDDAEVGNLRQLCDEVFGQENFVANIIWQKKYSPQNDARFLSDMHDHVLLYAKDKELWRPIPLPRTAQQNKAYKNPDDDPRGPWKATDSTCNKSRTQRPNLYYPIINPAGEEVWPLETRVWRFARDVHEAKAKDNRVWWGQEGTNAVPSYKSFLSEVKQGRVPTTIWSYEEAGHNQSARQELNQLLENNPFDTPKPTKLILRAMAISVTPHDGDIILDFFAGSGTTGHAVMAANAQDGGNRRFILVQLPETLAQPISNDTSNLSSIADLAAERLRRASEQLRSTEETCKDDFDSGFRMFKIDTSNMKDVYYAPDAVKQGDLLDQIENIKEDRTPEDLLFQVLLDWGVDLSLPVAQETIEGKTVFFVDENGLAACFDKEINEELVKTIAARKPLRAVFRDSGYGTDSVKINVEQIFKLISPSTEIKSI